MRRGLALLAFAPLLASCGGASQTPWRHLSKVVVTVAQPGLPPPYGAPKSTSFATPVALARITALLNAHHISRAPSSTASGGCAGGYTVLITILSEHAAPVRLSGYRCANQTSGDIAGDLVGFLSAVGRPV
jgi:hypothetical protein